MPLVRPIEGKQACTHKGTGAKSWQVDVGTVDIASSSAPISNKNAVGQQGDWPASRGRIGEPTCSPDREGLMPACKGAASASSGGGIC
eukprot:CAMPEP_0171065780 /NCGR_PEP_ID=MMETSP0766_2-20121228/7045_1 /TAXON_ID=439317 /ORGANISM="Gambierdiscus australes, Strain CAWD 149" /LENGTH=87 /DNA_ID=CAMNT_0011521909 /DNA_START=54 /DNA_END=315 /DNA_ORIENTATION=+